jgi:RNA-directed DNA polymerase
MFSPFSVNASFKDNARREVKANGLPILFQNNNINKKNPKVWHGVNWKESWKIIKDLQEKIVKATQRRDYIEVYKLQWIILNSFSGRALAIRKVITNSGGKTPGIDDIIWKTPKDYMKALDELALIVKNINKYKASPLKRVYIQKGNSKEMRGLGIPTIMDRAIQALYHLGIDPVVEVDSDRYSFGFRKNRSTHDAITALRNFLDKSVHPRWILKVDIRKCFDKINQNFLIKNTPICHKIVLEQWLKSGIMEEMNYIETKEGTPQGGIISPTLCNIALNGLEKILEKVHPKKKQLKAGVHVIRYADDLIITGKNKEILLKVKEVLIIFLKERGLELNEEKTKIVQIKKGFDFLGFNIRRMNYNPRLNKKSKQKTILIIKPSKSSINKLKLKIRKHIDKNKPIEGIIRDINPILRGWGEHKRISYHSQETFITFDHWMYLKMMSWITRHKGSKLRNLKKYMIRTKTRTWNWGLSNKQIIINLGELPIIKIVPLRLSINPYILANEEYFIKRKEKKIFAKLRAAIYKKFKHTCLSYMWRIIA